MRRPSLALLLSLLLVFVQHGAMLHELGHLSHSDPAAGTALHADTQGRNAAYCPSCEGFAQVAHPATAGIPAMAVCPGGYLPALDPRYAILAVNTPTPRSRGPPQA
jgi:hypothetical protein